MNAEELAGTILLSLTNQNERHNMLVSHLVRLVFLLVIYKSLERHQIHV